MKIQPIADQLGGIGLVTIGGILEWAALKVAPGRLPAGYVVPTSERASANRNDTGIDQRVEAEFMVALVLEAGGRSLKQVNEQLADMSAQVKAKLNGWRHPDSSAPTTYSGGELLSLEGQTLAWALRFRTAYHLRTTR